MLQSSPFPPIETFATFQFVATPVCTSSIALLLIKMLKIYSFADVAWEVVLSLKQITKESFLKMNVRECAQLKVQLFKRTHCTVMKDLYKNALLSTRHISRPLPDVNRPSGGESLVVQLHY